MEKLRHGFKAADWDPRYCAHWEEGPVELKTSAGTIGFRRQCGFPEDAHEPAIMTLLTDFEIEAGLDSGFHLCCAACDWEAVWGFTTGLDGIVRAALEHAAECPGRAGGARQG